MKNYTRTISLFDNSRTTKGLSSIAKIESPLSKIACTDYLFKFRHKYTKMKTYINAYDCTLLEYAKKMGKGRSASRYVYYYRDSMFDVPLPKHYAVKMYVSLNNYKYISFRRSKRKRSLHSIATAKY